MLSHSYRRLTGRCFLVLLVVFSPVATGQPDKAILQPAADWLMAGMLLGRAVQMPTCQAGFDILKELMASVPSAGNEATRVVLDFFSAVKERVVNLHFVPQPSSQSPQQQPSLILTVPDDSEIHSINAVGASNYAWDAHQIFLKPDTEETIVFIAWWSQFSSHLDIIILQPDSTQDEVCTYSLAVREPAASMQATGLPEDSYSSFVSKVFSGSHNSRALEINEESNRQCYLAKLQAFLDMWFGDYVLLIASEHYSGAAQGGGTVSSVCVSSGLPCHPFNSNGRTARHYRNALLIWGRCPNGRQCPKGKKNDGTDGGHDGDQETGEEAESNVSQAAQKGVREGAVLEGKGESLETFATGGADIEGHDSEKESDYGVGALQEIKGVPALIVNLVNRLVQVLDENEGDFDKVEESDGMLYSLALVAIGEFMDTGEEETSASRAVELAASSYSGVYQQTYSYLEEKGIAAQVLSYDSFYYAKIEHLPRSQKAKKFYIPQSFVMDDEELPELVEALIEFMIVDYQPDPEESEAYGELAEKTAEWKATFYCYALRMLFDSDPDGFLDWEQQAFLTKKLDEGLPGDFDWRRALVTVNPGDSIVSKLSSEESSMDSDEREGSPQSPDSEAQSSSPETQSPGPLSVSYEAWPDQRIDASGSSQIIQTRGRVRRGAAGPLMRYSSGHDQRQHPYPIVPPSLEMAGRERQQQGQPSMFSRPTTAVEDAVVPSQEGDLPISWPAFQPPQHTRPSLPVARPGEGVISLDEQIEAAFKMAVDHVKDLAGDERTLENIMRSFFLFTMQGLVSQFDERRLTDEFNILYTRYLQSQQASTPRH